MNIREFITKIQNFSDQRKKTIIVIVVIVLAFICGFIWIRLAMARLDKLSESLKNIKFPEVSYSEVKSPVADEVADWKTYTNLEYGFEIKYSKDTDFSESSSAGVWQVVFNDQIKKTVPLIISVNKTADIKIDYKQVVGDVTFTGITGKKIKVFTASADNCQAILVDKNNLTYSLSDSCGNGEDLYNQMISTFKFTK